MRIAGLQRLRPAVRASVNPTRRSVTTLQFNGSDTNASAPRRPLEGIRVVECGHLIAGPFAGTILSYFGAEVIKIEPPTGDQVRVYRELDDTKTSLWWYSLGRNKKSVSIDIRKEEGRALVRELVGSSDVLVENFKPGRMEKWGLGPEVFEKENPGLVYARISGFGQNGPYSSRDGWFSVRQRISRSSSCPSKPQYGDTITGIHAALGILIALLGRERSTQKLGQVIDVAIYESMFNLLESVVPEYDYAGVIRECSGSTITGIVPSNTYVSKDKKYVVIAANTDTLFIKLMNAIGRPDLATDPQLQSNPGRVVRQTEIDDVMAQWTSTKTEKEAIQAMEEAGVPVGLVYSVEDMFKDPQYNHRGMFEEVQIGADSSQTLKIPAIMPKLLSTPGKTTWAGHKIGQDTRDVLGQILMRSDSQIEQLLRDEIVFEPRAKV